MTPEALALRETLVCDRSGMIEVPPEKTRDLVEQTPEPPSGRIEISPEEISRIADGLSRDCRERYPGPPLKELVAGVTEFAEWAGFDNNNLQAAHILLLCLHSDRPRHPDLTQLCELVGCTREFAERIMDRVREQKIFESFDWPNEDGEVGLMLDTMVATGILERRLKGSELEYHMAPEAPLRIGEYVKHKSGFGSGWWIAAEKYDEDGKQFVRLQKGSRPTPNGGGKWRDASIYVRGKRSTKEYHEN